MVNTRGAATGSKTKIKRGQIKKGREAARMDDGQIYQNLQKKKRK